MRRQPTPTTTQIGVFMTGFFIYLPQCSEFFFIFITLLRPKSNCGSYSSPGPGPSFHFVLKKYGYYYCLKVGSSEHETRVLFLFILLFQPVAIFHSYQLFTYESDYYLHTYPCNWFNYSDKLSSDLSWKSFWDCWKPLCG